MIFTFVKRIASQLNQAKQQAQEAEVPEWVTCAICELEIPSDQAQRWRDANNGDIRWTHPVNEGGYTCQQPYFREREIGRLKKPPPLLRRLPIWS